MGLHEDLKKAHIEENPAGRRCGACGRRVADGRLYLAANPQDPAKPLPVGRCCLENGFLPWRELDPFSCNDCWWTGTERPPDGRCPFCSAELCDCHGMSVCPKELPLGTARVFILPAEPGHFQEHSLHGVAWRSIPGVRALGVNQEAIAGLVVRFTNGDRGDRHRAAAAAAALGEDYRAGSYTVMGKEVWVYQGATHRAPTVMLLEDY